MPEWETIWRSFGLVVAITAVTLAVVALCAPHNVDYYYITHAGGSGPSICASAHWTWHGDEEAYCSDDVNKVLDFVQKANATVLHGK